MLNRNTHADTDTARIGRSTHFIRGGGGGGGGGDGIQDQCIVVFVEEM